VTKWLDERKRSHREERAHGESRSLEQRKEAAEKDSSRRHGESKPLRPRAFTPPKQLLGNQRSPKNGGSSSLAASGASDISSRLKSPQENQKKEREDSILKTEEAERKNNEAVPDKDENQDSRKLLEEENMWKRQVMRTLRSRTISTILSGSQIQMRGSDHNPIVLEVKPYL